MQELRSWGPGWLVWLPLAQADRPPPYTPPTLPSPPGTPAPSYWPITYKTKMEEMTITKRMKEPPTHSSPWKCPFPSHSPPSRANGSWGCFPPELAQQDPAAPLAGRHPTQSTPHSHRACPGTGRPLGGLRGPGLSILPPISWGNLGPKGVGTWFWEAEGTAREWCGKATCRVGNKYEKT